MNKVAVAEWSKLADRVSAYALVANVDLVVIRYGDDVSCCSGAACIALLADGSVEGDNLLCGLHGWDYRIQTGISEHNNHQVFHAQVLEAQVLHAQVLHSQVLPEPDPDFARWIRRIQNNSALPKDRPGNPW
jgi:nitrite reductase/ring-hydroxylating ferredoxin subunit